jgi:cytochrome P450
VPNYYGRKSFLERLEYAECVVREVKRYYPVVPFIPARVKKSFAYSGHLFPKGWLVLLGIPAIHLDGRVYRDPSTLHTFCAVHLPDALTHAR